MTLQITSCNKHKQKFVFVSIFMLCLYLLFLINTNQFNNKFYIITCDNINSNNISHFNNSDSDSDSLLVKICLKINKLIK